MSRYIDADALINKLDERCDAICQWTKKEREVMCGACPLADAFDMVDEFPTADVVEVIRCKDCEFYDSVNETMGFCELTRSGAYSDGFCAWAERRKE